MARRIVVGMSGGIDSFAAALRLQEQGWEVVGVHLSLWGEDDLRGVEALCRRLSIPLVVRDGREFFRDRVVEEFVRAYRMGHTPSPCCTCNRFVKWHLLEQAALDAGAERIATGHYVRMAERGGKHYVRRGVDEAKDQSYFLWGLSSRLLAKAVTPLGNCTKQEVKAWAMSRGYEVLAQRRESMGVCFLQGTDYRDFIRAYGGRAQEEQGDIVFRETGQFVGRHDGLANYTVGQRRGMPVVDGVPLYVAGVDVGRNLIWADVKSSLFSNVLYLEQLNVIDGKDLEADDLTLRVRGIGLNPQGTVRVERLAGGRCRVWLSEAAWAVASGQPVAFYRGDWLVGGGIVCRVEKVEKIDAPCCGIQ